MKKIKFLILASIAVLFLSITNTNAQYQAEYTMNLQIIKDVAIADDGGSGFLAVVSGTNNIGNEILMLVKLDMDFRETWVRSLDYSIMPLYMDLHAFDVKRDPAGGYAICGKYIDNSILPATKGGFLMSIDDNGNVQWMKDAREIWQTDRCEELRSVEIVSNHYVCCGYSIDNGQPKEGFIWSVDKNTQNVEWTRTETSDYPSQANVQLYDVVFNPSDNLLYFCGSWFDPSNNSPNEFVLASYDLSGVNVLSKKYTDNSLSFITASALAINGFRIYVTGNVNVGNSDDNFTACISNNGNVLWSYRLNIADGDRVGDFLYFNNDLYFAGSTKIPPKKALFMQTDYTGNNPFATLYSNPLNLGFEFHKMLYRTIYTNPSIIKIGMYDNSNIFSIVETYLPVQQGCYNSGHPVISNLLNLSPTDVTTNHTKIDFQSFPLIPYVAEPHYRNILCSSPYFASAYHPEKTAKSSLGNTAEENTDEIIASNNQINLPLSYQNAAYKLYSIDGKLIASGNVNNINSIDISSYTKGIYLLHLQSANKGIKTIKIIK
jgi:hypothetical protein